MKKSFLASLLIVALFSVSNVCYADDDQNGWGDIDALYTSNEQECLKKGWEELSVQVDGQKRQILYKEPRGIWTSGAVIVMHGGGGTHSNYCGNTRLAEPMANFAEMAINQGFAVFSLDSGRDILHDLNDVKCGKRWVSFSQEGRKNPDLDFIEQVLTKVIPEKRTEQDSSKIFMTGISNGGFMTVLAATHFDQYIKAFVPVSAGDPYGTEINCGENTWRKNAPGRWYDMETYKEIGEKNSCTSDIHVHEKKWFDSGLKSKPAFKMFHHEGDAAVDISCMRKTQIYLDELGYMNAGEHVESNWGRKRLMHHFWQDSYNQPILDFFKSVP